MYFKTAFVLSGLLTSCFGVVNITSSMPSVELTVNGKSVKIERIQNSSNKLKNSYVKTSRPAPPFSLQPIEPIAGITTIGELEIISFLQQSVATNKGLLIDARLQKWYQMGTIPTAINLPFSMLSANKTAPLNVKILKLLGANQSGGGWNFTNAQKLVIFDNGPWCNQGVLAMKSLIALGYPKNKILYYRGGMQYWQLLGFNMQMKK
ncbi:MAG: rhodanese-like domain-containing protein [Epsilonproteobacteria bacterium]|nr:rhodanese-like domain-containing protein [Campylobacterota bacterium]